jgi:manganese/zinc/iron transport system substrate-binding protein
MSDTLVRVATLGKPVFPVTDLPDESFLLEPEELAGHFDLHVWMDAQAWGKAVEAVSRTLSEFNLPNAGYYEANAAMYLKQVEALDAYVHRVVGTIPERQRVLVTAHDAFNYFGRAHGLEVRGIQGISTESEAVL